MPLTRETFNKSKVNFSGKSPRIHIFSYMVSNIICNNILILKIFQKQITDPLKIILTVFNIQKVILVSYYECVIFAGWGPANSKGI